MVAANTEREVRIKLTARDEASGVVASAGRSIMRSVKELKDVGNYGPAVKPRFDAETQAARDIAAGRVRAMRDAAVRARRESDAARMLFGEPQAAKQEVREVGRSHGEESAGGFLEGLKSKFGRGSLLKEGLEIAEGSGVVIGLTLAGRAMAELSESAVKFQEEMEEGKKRTGEMADEFLRALPVLGNIYTAGRNIREMFTGDELALRKATEEAAKLNEQMAVFKDRNVSIKNIMRESAETLHGLADRRALAGLGGASLEDQQAALQAAKERRDIEERARVRREQFTGVDGDKRKAAHLEMVQAQRDLDEANIQIEWYKANGLAKKTASGGSGFEVAQRRADELMAKRDLAARNVRSIDDSTGIIDGETLKTELAASKDAEAAELAGRQKYRDTATREEMEASLVAIRDRQIQTNHERLDSTYAFNKSLESAEAESIANRLRAAGNGIDAEKVMRAEQHKRRLADIDEAARKEKMAHAEDAALIEERRQKLAGAENESFGASEAAAARERAQQFLPSLTGAAIEGFGLSGAVSAGALESRLGQRDKEDKAATEVSKLRDDTKALFGNLIDALKGAGVVLTTIKPSPI